MNRVSKIRFPKIRGKILPNEPLSKHTTLRIGGPCELWIEPYNEKNLKKTIKFVRKNNIKTFVMGAGSNVLANDKGFNGIVVNLKGPGFREIKFKNTGVIAGAGVFLPRLISAASKKGLSGIEYLTGIPGTVGGAVFMNASYKRDISECIEKVKVMDGKTGDVKFLRRKNINFGYRQSGLNRYIILQVVFKLKRAQKKNILKKIRTLLNDRGEKQPLEFCTPGCVFKNPRGRMSAGRYIEMAGLKGKKIGGAAVSKKHANFIINSGKASAKDVLKLIKFIKKTVKSRFGIKLVPEVILI